MFWIRKKKRKVSPVVKYTIQKWVGTGWLDIEFQESNEWFDKKAADEGVEMLRKWFPGSEFRVKPFVAQGV